MTNSYRAENIFKNLPEDIKGKIFKAAEGKLVYFAKSKKVSQMIDSEKVLLDYSRKIKSYNDIAREMGTNKMKICRIINKERKDYSKKRVKYWRKKGLTLPEIARLYKKSHKIISEMVIDNGEYV